MSAKEELINELLQSRRSPEAAKDEKPKKEPKARRIPTKEEREAYRQRMIEKEEREALKRMGIVDKKTGEKKSEPSSEEPKPAPSKGPVKAKKPNVNPKPKAKMRHNVRPKVKKIKSFELPNGDSLLIIYVPGGAQ